jgi:hypothetical protein
MGKTRTQKARDRINRCRASLAVAARDAFVVRDVSDWLSGGARLISKL